MFFFNLFVTIAFFFNNFFGIISSDLRMEKKDIQINDKKIEVELAQTPEQQIQGLSDRRKLGDDKGMLFLFTDYKLRSFWMKDMRFAIDIIWIKDNKIADITANVAPPKNKGDYLKIYQPKEKVDKVLEVNAGFVEGNNVKIGDAVKY